MSTAEQCLHDELAIRNLITAYGHAVMRLDAEAAAATYADDGVLSAFYYPDVVGKPAIGAALAQALAPIHFIVHGSSASVIEIDGDGARATSSISEWLQYRDHEDLACCFGAYEDTLQRTAAGWRFARRRFVPFYRGSVPASGKLYPVPQFEHAFAPWPFTGSRSG